MLLTKISAGSSLPYPERKRGAPSRERLSISCLDSLPQFLASIPCVFARVCGVLLLFEELGERRVDIGDGRLNGRGLRDERCGLGSASRLCGQGNAVVDGRQDGFARNAPYGCVRIQVDDFEIDLFFGHRVSQAHDDALLVAFAVEHDICRFLLCVRLGRSDDVFAPFSLLCLTVSVGVDLRWYIDDLVGSAQFCGVAGVDCGGTCWTTLA